MSKFQTSNEAVIPEKLIQCVKASVATVFEQSFGIFPDIQADDQEMRPLGDGIVGIISYTGDLAWMMMLGFPKDCVTGWFAKFAGFELDYDSLDMADAVGEMANILAGNVVGRLSESNVKCAMSLPTLIKGHNVEPLLPRDLPSKKLIVTLPEGMVTLKIVGAKPGMIYGQSPGT